MKNDCSLQPPAHAGSSYTLKMEAICSSETSVNTISTRRHIPEHGILKSTCSSPGVYLLSLSEVQQSVKGQWHTDLEAEIYLCTLKQNFRIIIRIAPKNSTAIFAHRFNSLGYRTYW
jgi:hypothetical protein